MHIVQIIIFMDRSIDRVLLVVQIIILLTIVLVYYRFVIIDNIIIDNIIVVRLLVLKLRTNFVIDMEILVFKIDVDPFLLQANNRCRILALVAILFLAIDQLAETYKLSC